MRYTIHGFSQIEALKFRKEVEEKGKTKIIKIDSLDLLILRWFVDFYPNMIKIEVNGVQYASVVYTKVLEDIPLIDIGKQMLAVRFKKLAEFGILKKYTLRQGGTFSYFGFGDNYIKLVTDNNNYDGIKKNIHPSIINYTPLYNKLDTVNKNIIEQRYNTKDKSIKDYSINNNYNDEFDKIWQIYPRKLGKANALKAYIKARKNGTDYDTIKQGVNNYVDYIKQKQVKPEYIKHGSTWFNQECWNDEYEVKKRRNDLDEIFGV